MNANDIGSVPLAGPASGPDFDDEFVHRDTLIERIVSRDSRLVTVTAPAGYGKTSFLAEWRQSEGRVTEWVSIQLADNDPAALLLVLARSCAALLEEADDFLASMPSAEDVLGRQAPYVAAALSRASRPFVLFLDDVHLLDQSGCTDVLDIVLTGVPHGSQAVLAGRRQLDQLARGRLAASATRVDADDLRIDVAGAARIAERAGAQVDAGVLETWVQQSAGWAAGLHMCALVAREGRPPTSAHSDRLVADYLYRECLQELPEELRDFLVHTSVLEVHIPELCDAVTDRSDSARVLRELERRQLFTTLDRAGHAYRVHGLFREFLLDELLLDAPSLATRLHGRAAQWFAERGRLPQAIDHAIAAGDMELATGLVIAAAVPAYESGQSATLARWLAEIGDINLMANAAAVAVLTWFSVLVGSDADATKWSTLLAALPDHTVVEGTSIASAKAMIRAIMLPDTMQQALADAAFAESEETLDSPWRGPAVQILGSTLLHSGDTSAGLARLREAAFIAEARNNAATRVICETEFALAAIDDSQWEAASQHLSTALRLISEHRIDAYVMCPYAYALAAFVELRRGRSDEGERYLFRAMADRQRCGAAVPLIAVPTRIFLAQAHLHLGAVEAARILLDEIDALVPARRRGDAMQLRITAVHRALQKARQRATATSQPVVLTAAEQRLLPFLQTHLTRAEIADRLFVSRNTVGSQISAIFRKFHVTTRADAVRVALEHGFLGAETTLPAL